MSLMQNLVSVVDKSKKRVGRGGGSGKGNHTSGRGTKGQKSRTGAVVPVWFEGGQLPLIKRLPMIKGKARFGVLNKTVEITLSDLNKSEAEVVTLDTLKIEGIIHKSSQRAKVIKSGELTKAVTVQGIRVSAAAKESIVSLGGSVID